MIPLDEHLARAALYARGARDRHLRDGFGPADVAYALTRAREAIDQALAELEHDAEPAR